MGWGGAGVMDYGEQAVFQEGGEGADKRQHSPELLTDRKRE